MDAYGFWILATSDCIHSTALLHLATRAPTSRAESHRHHRGQEPKSLEEPWLGLRYHINTWMSLPLSPGQASSHTSIDHGQKGVPLAGSWDESLDKRIHKWDETTIELLLTTRPFARQCLPPNKNVCGRLKLEFEWTVIRKNIRNAWDASRSGCKSGICFFSLAPSDSSIRMVSLVQYQWSIVNQISLCDSVKFSTSRCSSSLNNS